MSKSCYNCKYECNEECVLYDESVPVLCVCPLYNKIKNDEEIL